MEYIVHICERGMLDGLGDVLKLGHTKMYLNSPKVGDMIRLRFPDHYIKQNKWFDHLPDGDYEVIDAGEIQISTGAMGYLEVYYSDPKVSLKKIKDKNHK